MRVRAGEHALHADRADEHPRLAAHASIRALLPTQPSKRTQIGDAPLEHSVRDDPATAGAPSTGGVQSSCRVERHERRGWQQRGGQRATALVQGLMAPHRASWLQITATKSEQEFSC